MLWAITAGLVKLSNRPLRRSTQRHAVKVTSVYLFGSQYIFACVGVHIFFFNKLGIFSNTRVQLHNEYKGVEKIGSNKRNVAKF